MSGIMIVYLLRIFLDLEGTYSIGNYMERIFSEIGIRFISAYDGYDSKSLIGKTAGIDV